jgi:hypothetical protein
MFRLACTVDQGLFSHERLVRFQSALGEEYTALVDAGLVSCEGDQCWFGVTRTAIDDGRSLIAIPSDGSRVWVSSDALQPTT